MEIPFKNNELNDSRRGSSMKKVLPCIYRKEDAIGDNDNILNLKNNAHDLIFEEKNSLQNSTSSNLNCYILNNEINKVWINPDICKNYKNVIHNKKTLFSNCNLKMESILNQIKLDPNQVKEELFGNVLKEKNVELIFEYKKILSSEGEENIQDDSNSNTNSILKFIFKIKRTKALQINNGIGILNIIIHKSEEKLISKKASYKNRGRDIYDCLVILSKWISYNKNPKAKKDKDKNIIKKNSNKRAKAKNSNVSTKTIDYYYMYIKKGIKLHYNFESNLKTKFSCLKNWVTKQLNKEKTKEFNKKYKMTKKDIHTKINNLILQFN